VEEPYRTNEEAPSDEPEPDTTFDALEPPFEEPPPKPSLARRARGWLVAFVFIGALALGGRVLGEHYYNPPSRLPATVEYPLQPGLLSANGRVIDQVGVAAGWFPAGELELSLTGEVYELGFPRTVADRLFGKRDETATIFTATTPQGGEHRLLVLGDGVSEPVIAIEAPISPSGASGVEGLFLRLPPPDTAAPLANVAAAVNVLLPELEAAKKHRISSSDYTVFGPFDRGDVDALKQRIEANVVLSHLAGRLEAEEADVSIAAPVFAVEAAPEHGSIRGIYMGRLRLVQEPLWEDSETSTLGHELTHANIDRVLPDAAGVLRTTADYMDAAHPRLFRDVVGDLYERLDRPSRAEEALAFVMGAIAAGQIKTVAPDRLLSNQGLATISEPVLKSDIELLVRIGLLPGCMEPAGLGQNGRELGFGYYDAADAACKGS
jgi:hypothetical protein